MDRNEVEHGMLVWFTGSIDKVPVSAPCVLYEREEGSCIKLYVLSTFTATGKISLYNGFLTALEKCSLKRAKEYLDERRSEITDSKKLAKFDENVRQTFDQYYLKAYLLKSGEQSLV